MINLSFEKKFWFVTKSNAVQRRCRVVVHFWIEYLSPWCDCEEGGGQVLKGQTNCRAQEGHFGGQPTEINFYYIFVTSPYHCRDLCTGKKTNSLRQGMRRRFCLLSKLKPILSSRVWSIHGVSCGNISGNIPKNIPGGKYQRIYQAVCFGSEYIGLWSCFPLSSRFLPK